MQRLEHPAAASVVAGSFDRVLVGGRLFSGHRRAHDTLLARRQFGEPILLEAPHQQRRPPAYGVVQRRFQRGHVAGGVRPFIGCAEATLVTQVPGCDAIDDGPKVGQAVFDRRAGECDAKLGVHRLGGVGHANRRCLYLLRLIHEHAGAMQ